MNVKIVSCWFATSYGTYTNGLRKGLERKLGREVGIIASNCGCGDPMEVSRTFVDRRCSFIEFPNVPYATMSTRPKQLVLDTVRKAAYCERARRYMKETGDADVVHFQQILNAFGSIAATAWLDLPCNAARVVTVHELDPYQKAHPDISSKYAKADALVVHTNEMRSELIALGAWRERVHVIQHGVDLQSPSDEPRSNLIFYGGHKLENGKGALALFAALAIAKETLGTAMPRLRVHGHYTETGANWAKKSAQEAGLERDIDWLDQIDHETAIAEYRRARAVLLPYTGGFAGYPASLAAASGAAVIGTRRAGLLEHLGENGAFFVPERDPTALAAAIVRVVRDEGERRRIADAARAYAERELGWDAIAKKTAAVYEEAVARSRVSHEMPALHG